jgi:hypothetical protein
MGMTDIYGEELNIEEEEGAYWITRREEKSGKVQEKDGGGFYVSSPKHVTPSTRNMPVPATSQLRHGP